MNAAARLAGRLREDSREDSRGITLVETLVVMLILGVVGSVTTAALVSTHEQHRLVDDESRGLADVRVVVERLGRDVRQARSIDAGATGAKLVLWIDYNSDYIRDPVSQPDEIVTWQLQAQGAGSTRYNVLRQTSGGVSRVEARTLVSDIAFHYYPTAGGSEMVVPSTGLTASDASAATVVTAELKYDAMNGAGAFRVTTFTERLRNVENQ